MTDEELQTYADGYVRLTLGGKTLTGKLISGFAAQVGVNAPYAIRWHDVNQSSNTEEVRLVAIPNAEAVESIELIDEDSAAEIKDEAEDAQTPG